MSTETGPRRRGQLSEGYVTPRELAVWRAMAMGSTTLEIAAELGVGRKTVDKFRCEVFRKLKARNLADITRFAVRRGVIEIGPVVPLQERPVPTNIGHYFE